MKRIVECQPPPPPTNSPLEGESLPIKGYVKVFCRVSDTKDSSYITVVARELGGTQLKGILKRNTQGKTLKTIVVYFHTLTQLDSFVYWLGDNGISHEIVTIFIECKELDYLKTHFENDTWDNETLGVLDKYAQDNYEVGSTFNHLLAVGDVSSPAEWVTVLDVNFKKVKGLNENFGNSSERVFCYGSNMLTQRLIKRLGSVKLIGTAKLNGYSFSYNKKSKDGSTKANIIKTDNDLVFGVVFEITTPQKYELDKFEGNGYKDKEVLVEYLDGSKENVLCYIATDNEYLSTEGTPSYDWYKEFIMQGAKEHSLPEDYISFLDSFKSIKDPNILRQKRCVEVAKQAKYKVIVSYPDEATKKKIMDNAVGAIEVKVDNADPKTQNVSVIYDDNAKFTKYMSFVQTLGVYFRSSNTF